MAKKKQVRSEIERNLTESQILMIRVSWGKAQEGDRDGVAELNGMIRLLGTIKQQDAAGDLFFLINMAWRSEMVPGGLLDTF